MWTGLVGAFASISQVRGTTPAPKCARADPKHLTGLEVARTGCNGIINQLNGHLFHVRRNQSSSSVPQMARAFFDKVSNAAASASAFSLRRSSFSS